jgi:THO complex subunit 3
MRKCHWQGKVKDIELKGHTDCVDQLCWDPKQPDVVATCSGDKTVRLWDTRSNSTYFCWCFQCIV